MIGRGARFGVPATVFAFLLGAGVSPARAQVSPGPLATAHQELDVGTGCFNCHGKGEGAMRARCLACHREIARLVDGGLGLHGQKNMENCAACHPDHAGREFAMITFDAGGPEKFDHARAGWPLAGRHAALRCADCHRREFRTSETAKLSKRKDPDAGWIGLERGCSSCHAAKDVHRGRLGPDCSRCHDERAWKPAPRFDHQKTGYPLTGRHATVACDACHRRAGSTLERDAAGKPLPQYKPLPHAECSACHADPHAGRLGADCSRCHATDAWKRVERGRFDHDRTRYPLRGRHAALACDACHDARVAWGKKPPFAACADCHADAKRGHDDPHAGQATLAGKKADCAACHDLEGFKTSTYTVAQHRAAAYPLEGKHAAVACRDCHRRNPPGVPPGTLGRSGVLLRMRHARCTDCHADAHGGQLKARADQGACESCHDVGGFKPARFSVADHARLRLPLDGAHAKVKCAACHGPERPGLPPLPGADRLGTARVALRPTEIACGDCHVDPHAGRFAARGARPRAAGCPACHSAERFRPALIGVAEHVSCGYPLEGAHRTVACDGCHAEIRGPRPVVSSLLLPRRTLPPMTFAVADRRCEACHRNPHGDQFARRKGGGACAACHNEAFFKPASRFDHARDAGFALDGAHARVPCSGCHPSRRDASGATRVVYRPVPRECKACHGEKRR